MLNSYPREDQRPLRVAILCSQRAPGVLQLLRDARRGDLFDIVACVSSEHDFADRAAVADKGVPTFVHDIHDFYRGWNAALSDMQLRRHYDEAILQRLALYDVDVVILCSYFFVVTPVLLEAYPERVINIHHGDVASYPGLHAVRDAIAAGESETRTTAHIVTRAVDAGPPIVRSWAFPVHPMVADLRAWQAGRILEAYCYAHQEWMIESAWAPVMLAAIELIARGQLQLWGDAVLINGSTRPLELEASARSIRAMRALHQLR